jgi:hypothetical protein
VGILPAVLSQYPSRQVRRAAERAGVDTSKRTAPPWGWVETGAAILVLVGSIGLSLAAWIEDARAFLAIATPSLYCWLALCLLSGVGVALTLRARWTGISVPVYFRLALLAGVACGLFTLSPAWHVLTKQEPRPPSPTPGAHLDLRNRMIEDTSFAGRALRGSNFSGATLRHVDLSGADLSESDLRNTKFENSNLTDVNLCGADMRGADLRGAHGLLSDDWSYVFYSPGRTLLPRSIDYLLNAYAGPIPDNGRDLLYMCTADITKRVRG